MAEALHFTMGGLLEDVARRFPDQDALVYPDRGLRITYRELDKLTDRVARGLLRLGLRKGDHAARDGHPRVGPTGGRGRDGLKIIM